MSPYRRSTNFYSIKFETPELEDAIPGCCLSRAALNPLKIIIGEREERSSLINFLSFQIINFQPVRKIIGGGSSGKRNRFVKVPCRQDGLSFISEVRPSLFFSPSDESLKQFLGRTVVKRSGGPVRFLTNSVKWLIHPLILHMTPPPCTGSEAENIRSDFHEKISNRLCVPLLTGH